MNKHICSVILYLNCYANSSGFFRLKNLQLTSRIQIIIFVKYISTYYLVYADTFIWRSLWSVFFQSLTFTATGITSVNLTSFKTSHINHQSLTFYCDSVKKIFLASLWSYYGHRFVQFMILHILLIHVSPEIYCKIAHFFQFFIQTIVMVVGRASFSIKNWAQKRKKINS